MSELCFDLCPVLLWLWIARHNSRCENGWLISFYSWHRGLGVSRSCSAQARGSAHRVLASDQPQPGPETRGAHLSAARQLGAAGTQETRTGAAGWASVRVYCAARVTRPGPAGPSSLAASLADWSRCPASRRATLIGLSLAKLPPSRLLRPDPGLSITRSPDLISSNL